MTPVPDHPAPASQPGSPRVFIACGGTGGHLFPGLAVAGALRAHGIASLLGISPKAVDRTATEGRGDVETVVLPARPMPRPWSPSFPAFVGSLRATYRVCRASWERHGVQAVLGMGGFTSLVPVWAGRRAHLPVFLHDSNAIPGKANRLAGRWADTVFLGMADAARWFRQARTETVGTPVREEFLSLPAQAEARRKFGLDPERRTVLVLGGSQGSRALNRATLDAAGLLPAGSLQILMLTGPELADETERLVAAQKPGVPVVVVSFCHDMPAAYACADLAVARAGASTLSELAVCGLPAVLVPYPHAADDHQTANARSLADARAARLLPERELGGEALAACWRDLLGGSDPLSQMSAAMRSLAFPHAAEAMARRIAASLP